MTSTVCFFLQREKGRNVVSLKQSDSGLLPQIDEVNHVQKKHVAISE
jgi:hypothetical protein